MYLICKSSDENYARYAHARSLLGPSDGPYEKLPKKQSTIRKYLWELFKDVFELKEHDIVVRRAIQRINPLSMYRNTPATSTAVSRKILTANICQVIHMWINSKACLEVIRAAYLKHTAPHLNDIDLACRNHSMNTNRTYSGKL